MPIFAQMGKKNYFTEALAYSVNFTCRWPLAIGKLVQQSCSLNISGVEGHNVAIDDFVETFLVQPLKQCYWQNITESFTMHVCKPRFGQKGQKGVYVKGWPGHSLHKETLCSRFISRSAEGGMVLSERTIFLSQQIEADKEDTMISLHW